MINLSFLNEELHFLLTSYLNIFSGFSGSERVSKLLINYLNVQSYYSDI